MQSKLFTQFLTLLLAIGAFSLPAQTPFFTESFSDETTALANWTGGGENPGPENWEWSDDPTLGGFNAFTAPTAADGFLAFDSDANEFNEHAVTLTSPEIDCSGKNQVFLEMFTQYVFYNQFFSQVELGVSTDGGTTYVYQDILTDVPPGSVFVNAQRVVLAIPDAINQPSVTLQIRWTGFFEYFLHIDDVSLYDTAPILANDLSLQDPLYPLYYQTPISQVDSIFFLGVASNDGADPQTNTQMRVSVLDPDGNQVYQDSSDKSDMLMPEALDTLELEEGFLPSELGTHFVFQTVLADESDEFTGNNREVFDFRITENLYAVDDNDFQSVFIPDVGAGNFFESGNFYYIKNGTGYEADSIQFAVASDSENSHIGLQATILLYKIEEDDEVGFSDGDLELVGSSIYEFQDDDTNFQEISAPLLQDDGITEGVPLEDSTEYLLLVSLPQEIGVVYTYRDLIYEIGSIIRIDGDFFGRFSDADGSQLPLAFVVRMGIRELLPNAADEPELADSRINSFPNPARDFYRIDLDLENTSQVQLQLMSMSGQVILQREYTALQRDRIDLDVSDLAAGAYLVKIRTEEGVKTLKLTKQ